MGVLAHSLKFTLLRLSSKGKPFHFPGSIVPTVVRGRLVLKRRVVTFIFVYTYILRATGLLKVAVRDLATFNKPVALNIYVYTKIKVTTLLFNTSLPRTTVGTIEPGK